MKTEPTAQEIAFHRKNGFVVIEDFLDAGELATWRAAVDEAVAGRAGEAPMLPRREDPSSRSAYFANVFLQVINLWQDSERVRALVLDPRIGRLAATLEGVDGYRLWHDQALIKRPWDNATTFHVDCPYWSFDTRHAISIWVALDDATLQNGCMYFLPGSHHHTHFDPADIGENMNALFALYPDFADIEPVPVPMKAGSCSFHNALTVHGAGPNMTPRFRRAMTWGFMPIGSTFNGKPNVPPDQLVATLSVGDELCNDQQNPVLYVADR